MASGIPKKKMQAADSGSPAQKKSQRIPARKTKVAALSAASVEDVARTTNLDLESDSGMGSDEGLTQVAAASSAHSDSKKKQSSRVHLVLVRHAIAEPRGDEFADRDRPLTAKGRRRMGRAARGLAVLGVRCDVIVSSPVLRARQTAEILLKALTPERSQIVYLDALSPDGEPERLLDTLRQLDPPARHIVLVGHEPDLGNLAGEWLGGPGGSMLQLKKGGACKVSMADLERRDDARLDWLLTPGQLRRARRGE